MGIGASRSYSVANVLERVLKERAIVSEFHRWIHSSESVAIFVTGKTGSGKSTLVNAFIGERVAKEGEFDPITDTVTEYPIERDGVTLKVWDSPGLQDGTDQEERYIADMKAKCTNVDLYLLCINIVDSIRFNRDNPEIKAMKKLTNTFGSSMWDNTIIILTYANELEKHDQSMKVAKQSVIKLENRLSLLKQSGSGDTEDFARVAEKLEEEKTKLEKFFCEKISDWDRKIRHLLVNEVKVNPTQVENLKIIPAGFRDCCSLPDRPHWLSTFWFNALTSTKEKAQPALIHLNRSRIVRNSDEVSEEDMKKHVGDQFHIFTEKGVKFGEEIGAAGQGIVLGLEMAQMENLKLVELMLLEKFEQFLKLQSSEDEKGEEEPDIEKSRCGGQMDN